MTFLFREWEEIAREATRGVLRGSGVRFAGTIFKRFDTAKLFMMTCQDVVERFHLCLALLFVAAEDAGNGAGWFPQPALLGRCAQIFGAEICIDVIKHAVLGKFNEIRPGVYREFTRVRVR